MQSDIEDRHEQKRRRQYQWNRQRHHKTGAYTEAEKRHGQYDDDRFGQRADKLAHASTYRAWLIVDTMQLKPDRQCRFDPGERRVQVFAKFDNVAVGAHRHAEPECWRALIAHARERRIGVAPCDGGDVANPEVAAVGA